MKYCRASLVAALLLGSNVHAQQPLGGYTPPTVSQRPTISPYLNLNRGSGLNSATNYFGIVRPQFDNQQALQQLQQQNQATQGMLQNQAGQVAFDEMTPTGHRLGGFFNYGHYYPLFSQGGGAAGTAPGLVNQGNYGTGLAGAGVGGNAFTTPLVVGVPR